MKAAKHMKYIFIAAIAACNISCSNWLDVGSKDRIMENDLFKTAKGFEEALNGVYNIIGSPEFYGDKLTVGTFDVLAQYFPCDTTGHRYERALKYDETTKNTFVSPIWDRSYNMIQNVNTIIENCDVYTGVLPETHYNIIKGEALALRALFHFELFRIFGPIYSQNPDQLSIMYSNTTDLIIRPYLPARKIGELILQDLKKAEQLLIKSDPIINSGVMFTSAEEGLSNFLRYRNIRMNYFAVQALIARVSLYLGEKKQAFEYAEKVIQKAFIDNKWFMFADRTQVEGPPGKADRIYQSEVIFGGWYTERRKMYDSYFESKLNPTMILYVSQKVKEQLYSENDLRRSLFFKMKNQAGEDYDAFIKYMDVDDVGENKISRGFRNTIPILKLSELFLISAECNPDPMKGRARLNEVRVARKIPDLDLAVDLQEAIDKEFRAEFIGEGQLFWYYKRLAKKAIPNAIDGSPLEMTPSFYLFTIPTSETNNRED